MKPEVDELLDKISACYSCKNCAEISLLAPYVRKYLEAIPSFRSDEVIKFPELIDNVANSLMKPQTDDVKQSQTNGKQKQKIQNKIRMRVLYKSGKVALACLFEMFRIVCEQANYQSRIELIHHQSQAGLLDLAYRLKSMIDSKSLYKLNKSGAWMHHSTYKAVHSTAREQGFYLVYFINFFHKYINRNANVDLQNEYYQCICNDHIRKYIRTDNPEFSVTNDDQTISYIDDIISQLLNLRFIDYHRKICILQPSIKNNKTKFVKMLQIILEGTANWEILKTQILTTISFSYYQSVDTKFYDCTPSKGFCGYQSNYQAYLRMLNGIHPLPCYIPGAKEVLRGYYHDNIDKEKHKEFLNSLFHSLSITETSCIVSYRFKAYLLKLKNIKNYYDVNESGLLKDMTLTRNLWLQTGEEHYTFIVQNLVNKQIVPKQVKLNTFGKETVASNHRFYKYLQSMYNENYAHLSQIINESTIGMNVDMEPLDIEALDKRIFDHNLTDLIEAYTHDNNIMFHGGHFMFTEWKIGSFASMKDVVDCIVYELLKLLRSFNAHFTSNEGLVAKAKEHIGESFLKVDRSSENKKNITVVDLTTDSVATSRVIIHSVKRGIKRKRMSTQSQEKKIKKPKQNL